MNKIEINFGYIGKVKLEFAKSKLEMKYIQIVKLGFAFQILF